MTAHSTALTKVILVACLIGSLIGMVLGLYGIVDRRFRNEHFRGRILEPGTRVSPLSPAITCAMCVIAAVYSAMMLKDFQSEPIESFLGISFFVLVLGLLGIGYYDYRRWKSDR